MVVEEINKSIKERLRVVKMVERYILNLTEQEKLRLTGWESKL